MANASKLRKEIRAAAPDLVERIDRLAHAWLSPLLERLDSGDVVFRAKLVNDPIWGAIELSPWEVALLDTDMLQRMRGVRQLGLAQLVFPGAGHGRLEHIIGVIGAVETMLDALAQQIKRRNRDAEANGHSLLPEIKDGDRLALRLAALFHDLGHGPFSHALEPVMHPQAVLRADDEAGGWRQELKTLTEEFKERYQFNEEPAESEVIAALIVLSEAVSKVLAHGELRLPADVTPTELQMRIVACIVGAVEGDYADHLSAVISGQIDADKLDYLQRDAHHAGLEIGFDTDRLLARLEILQVRPENIDASVGDLRIRVAKAPQTTLLQLGIAASGFGSFEQMLIGRTFLYDRLYHHHKVRAAEAMAQRLILVAERDRTRRFDFEDIFVNMGDEVILRVFAGDVELPGFEPICEPARQLAKGILKRDLLHRAFALRGRFIGVGAGLDSEQADPRRRMLWGRLVDDLKSLKRRYEVGEKIHALALDCCEALEKAGVTEPDLTALRARLEVCGPEQVIVDLPALKASAIRILARYPNGALRIPEFSFNPVKWSNAYELQKRTTYVFAPRDVLPMVALASKIVFFGEYGVTMAAEADGFIKASGDLPTAWVQALVEAGIIDETARVHLTEARRSLTLVEAADLRPPKAWLDLDEDFALVLTRELNKALTGGIASEHLDALGRVLEAMWRLVDTWHDKGLLTESFADERALQDKVKSLLGMTPIKVQEGLETSGGETDLLLEDLIILENKIHGVTRSPETAAAAAGQQGRRYGIALNSRIVLVVLAYEVPKGEKVKNKVDAVSVYRISGEDGRQVEIRFTLPYGAVTPSLEKADRSVRPAANQAKPRKARV